MEQKAVDVLRSQLKLITQTAIHLDENCNESGIDDLKKILSHIKNKKIKIKTKDGSRTGFSSDQITEETQKDVPKKRGRKPKSSAISVSSVSSKPEEILDDLEGHVLESLDDSFTSTSSSSSRTRRAAAQAAESKARFQSTVPLNTKLRRPTNFGEKQTKTVPPPAKCRRTRRNQSAGSSQSDEVNEELCNEKMIVDDDKICEIVLNNQCSVSLEKLNTPTINAFTNPKRRSSRSLDRSCKSGDLFDDSIPSRKKSNSTKGTHSLNDEVKETPPIAQSSPLSVVPDDGGFRGFDTTFVVGNKTEETQVLIKKTHKKQANEVNCEEMEETEISVKSRTKTLQKKETHSIIDIEEKENLNRKNETLIISKPDSPKLRSRTKVLKKAKNNQEDDKNAGGETESPNSLEIDMNPSKKDQLKSDCLESQSIPSKTRVLKKTGDEDQTDNESNNTRSRTKTIVKGTNNGLDSKDNLPPSKIERVPPQSPAPAKGELVKKRIEDFEKMHNGVEETEEELAVGRVTRNAVKSKVAVSTEDVAEVKQARNVPVAKVQSSSVKVPERLKMTPLAVNNRMTPTTDPSHKPQTNKWTSSSNRPNPVETNKLALVQKQATEETERKRKEEESLKRKAKEEEAKKKKEEVLKATAEEARRKRMEKLQKAAAAREAAEKEKERLAAKAEKEREEKKRQMAMEKEKQKEEHLKKKQLLQQKTLEHEERRKQEEAARLAKIKEQEDEQKRLDAMKERELELQKQHKAELRLAGAEKSKQGGKLVKVAAVNNAKLKMQGMTPSVKTNENHPTTSYEITPSREDRPPLPPKTENDYGIDDAQSGDSSDDESQPKKIIPTWARSENREKLLEVNRYLPNKLWSMFMQCDPNPDVNKIFAGAPMRMRTRTSSAVWNTPPKL